MKDFNPGAADGRPVGMATIAYTNENRIIEKLLRWIGIAGAPRQSRPVTTLCLRCRISNHDKFTGRNFRL
jgi:hypothetical protein